MRDRLFIDEKILAPIRRVWIQTASDFRKANPKELDVEAKKIEIAYKELVKIVRQQARNGMRAKSKMPSG